MMAGNRQSPITIRQQEATRLIPATIAQVSPPQALVDGANTPVNIQAGSFNIAIGTRVALAHVGYQLVIVNYLGTPIVPGQLNWNYLGDTGQPTLVNGWQTYDGLNYPPARFMKDAFGIVRLSGVITATGNPGGTVFTLPAGYRPAQAMVYLPSASGGNAVVLIHILPSGAFEIEAYGAGTGSGYVSLSGISFYAEDEGQAPQWQVPAFNTGWSNYGGIYATCGFFVDPDGFVHLKGTVAGVTNGAAIFTNPIINSAKETTALQYYGYIGMNTSGQVVNVPVYSSTAGRVDLGGITWKADGIGTNHWHGYPVPPAPTLVGGWSHYNTATYWPVAFFKDSAGIVHLQGLVKSGTATIFTLPPGYRPAYEEIFSVLAGGAIGRVDVNSNGSVGIVQYGTSGSNAYVSLDNITFPAEA